MSDSKDTVIHALNDLNDLLLMQIESLKCCGNCGIYQDMEYVGSNVCMRKCEYICGYDKCENWEVRG